MQGRLIYCRPHIPETPPKPAVSSDTTEDSNDKNDKPIEITVTEAALEPKKDTIPGLSETERIKSQKSAEKKKKAVAAKERKKQKKEEQKKETGAKKKLSKEDFLKNDEMSEAEINEKFEFSDYSSDEAEIFEDSKENLSDEEFLTPIQFASKFGRRQAALSTSTPNLAIQRKPSKRSASSPGDEEGNSKKHKVKSMLPIKKK
jgi:hypothetical protein